MYELFQRRSRQKSMNQFTSSDAVRFSEGETYEVHASRSDCGSSHTTRLYRTQNAYVRHMNTPWAHASSDVARAQHDRLLSGDTSHARDSRHNHGYLSDKFNTEAVMPSVIFRAARKEFSTTRATLSSSTVGEATAFFFCGRLPISRSPCAPHAHALFTRRRMRRAAVSARQGFRYQSIVLLRMCI